MSYDLEVLRHNREALLLAEVAGWLHDMGKFCDLNVEHLALGGKRRWPNGYAYKSVVDDPRAAIRLSHEASRLPKPDSLKQVLRTDQPRVADLLPAEAKQMLLSTRIRVDEQDYSLAELVMLGTPGFAGHRERTRFLEGKDGWLAAVLGVCHSEAHYDKQEPPKAELQAFPRMLISSPFGYERECFRIGDSLRGLDTRLQNLPWANLASKDPRSAIKAVEAQFRDGLADTRRPINEVTLADWGATAAAMFKAAVAGSILSSVRQQIRQWLSQTEIDHDLHWRVVWVGVDSLSFWSRAAQLPDLLARKRLLEGILNDIQGFCEDEAPLASEIYHDETGVAFLAADLPGDDEEGTTIGGLFRRAIADKLEHSTLAGELLLGPAVRPASKRGSGLDRALTLPPEPHRAEPAAVRTWWEYQPADICPVCGLRPQAVPSTREGRLGLCSVCAERRSSRAREWAKSLHTTIWTDEVGDANGRLALLVGQFGLSHWLDGTLVGTLLVAEPPGDGTAQRKNPSFARLRRIWETTRGFWREVLPAGEDADLRESAIGGALGSAGPRLRISVENAATLGLAPDHAYDLVVGDVRLSVLYCRGALLSTDNLHYAAKQLGAKATVWRNSDAAAHYVAGCLRQAAEVPVEEPAGYGRASRLHGELRVREVSLETTAYTPAIPILAEPRTFMALVPADRALNAVQAIKDKYEREMNKVRNRLPLTLGAVYFDRRTPLAAALEAGRRMLRTELSPAEVRGWVVCANHQRTDPKKDSHMAAWQELTLQRGQRQVRLRISTVMGDGSTCDPWYPYFYLERPAPGAPLAGRKWRFSAPCPWEPKANDQLPEASLVHVAELSVGDGVYFAPSTFDYEYLDTTARRFEVSYAGGSRRGADKAQRPYLLEELGDLERVWQLLRPEQAARAQVKTLAGLIEDRRCDWHQPRGDEARSLPSDDPFRRFCEDALASVRWRSKPWKELAAEDRALLVSAALSGMLADALELHLTLGKEGDEERS